MNRRRRFHQRWLLWGLVWVFVLASLAPAISRMQAAAALAEPVQVADAARAADAAPAADAGVDGTICFPDEETAALFVQEEAPGHAAAPLVPTSRAAGPDPHAAHGHHAGIDATSGNLLGLLSVGMASLDCCPFCSIMADRLAPVWFDIPLLLDRTLVRARPELREPMPPAVVILRLPPVRGPPSPRALHAGSVRAGGA